jgi:hypothetical protein
LSLKMLRGGPFIRNGPRVRPVTPTPPERQTAPARAPGVLGPRQGKPYLRRPRRGRPCPRGEQGCGRRLRTESGRPRSGGEPRRSSSSLVLGKGCRNRCRSSPRGDTARRDGVSRCDVDVRHAPSRRSDAAVGQHGRLAEITCGLSGELQEKLRGPRGSGALLRRLRKDPNAGGSAGGEDRRVPSL